MDRRAHRGKLGTPTDMKTSRIASGLLLAAILLLAASSPANAAEAPLVPPGNSAVNQYTESFPTASGDRDAHGRDRNRDDRSPKKILGDKNAKELQERGPAGRAAAELAAATAPSAVEVDIERVDPPASSPNGNEGGGAGGAGGGNAGGASNGGGGAQQATAIPAAAIADAEGSSGLGTVLAKATGSSAGGMGLFLPLLILATTLWAGAYLARRHGRSVSA